MEIDYKYNWEYEFPNDHLVKIYFKTKIKNYLVAEILFSRSILDYKVRDYLGTEHIIEHFFYFKKLIYYYCTFNKVVNKYHYINFNWMRLQLESQDTYYVFIKYTKWFRLFYTLYNIKINNPFIKPFRKVYAFIKNNYADAYLFIKTKFNRNKNIDALTEFYNSK